MVSVSRMQPKPSAAAENSFECFSIVLEGKEADCVGSQED